MLPDPRWCTAVRSITSEMRSGQVSDIRVLHDVMPCRPGPRARAGVP